MDFQEKDHGNNVVCLIYRFIGILFLIILISILNDHQYIQHNKIILFFSICIVITSTYYYSLKDCNPVSKLLLLYNTAKNSNHPKKNIPINLYEYNDVPSKISKKRVKNKNSKKERSTKTINTSPIPYLKDVFAEFDKDFLKNAPIQTLSILSYFATSLFDKNNVDEVLWDIVENCISHLQLEDCVIYMLDKEKQFLIQKAAYGNKNNGEKKIVSPIKIKVGDGIVGSVLKTGKYQYIQDVTSHPTYIVDDASRMSELSVPIYVGGTVIGVLDSEHSEKNFFTDNHIFLFHLIAKLTEQKLKQLCNNSNTCNIKKDNSYFRELEFLMKEAKIYRDPNLGLNSVAQKLKISSNYLSQLVNKLTGKNFADYINTFRVEDAKSKLTNNSFVNYTIVGIGLESGFNSKSTFYSAFKKMVGISPSIYRKTC